MMRHFAVGLGIVLALAARVPAGEVGMPAPAVEPSEWINTSGPVSWSSLKGKVILVEKWATWCGPCVAQIPHLNELNEKYGKKGLMIIAVSDEAVATVKPFVESKEMKYPIAVKGANLYKTQSIPHSWLVDASGDVFWHGHPGELKEETIQERLKLAYSPPTFALPKELKAASKQLDAGELGAGAKALETYLKSPKGAEPDKAAKEALEAIKTYATEKLAQAESLAKESNYRMASTILEHIEKAYKGTEAGDKAKATLAAWKKDKTTKLELEAADLLDKALGFMSAQNWQAAAAALQKVTKGKKYETTKTREVAATKLRLIEKKL
jgi:thiol-disulfide isomerase/thioredoxin